MNMKLLKKMILCVLFICLPLTLLTGCSKEDKHDSSLTLAQPTNTASDSKPSKRKQMQKDPFALSFILFTQDASIKKIPPSIELTLPIKMLNIISFNNQKYRKTELFTTKELIDLWDISLTDQEYTPYASINFNGAIYSATIDTMPTISNKNLVITLNNIQKIETLKKAEDQIILVIENVGKTNMHPHELID